MWQYGTNIKGGIITTLKASRQRAKVTQAELARALGLTRSAYTRKENEQRRLCANELKTIKQYLKLSDEDFIQIFFED